MATPVARAWRPNPVAVVDRNVVGSSISWCHRPDSSCDLTHAPAKLLYALRRGGYLATGMKYKWKSVLRVC
jgi:hypothetical protein